MNLKVQKRVCAQILKCGPSRIVFDETKLDEIKEAITKADLKGLIDAELISKKKIKGVSRVRARKNAVQRRKGRRRGQGKRKGSLKVRQGKKKTWMSQVRVQRNFVKMLRQKDLIDQPAFRTLYTKIKGGFFRSRRHIKVYMTDYQLIKKK